VKTLNFRTITQE